MRFALPKFFSRSKRSPSILPATSIRPDLPDVTEDQIKEFRRVFNTYDKDRSNTICSTELAQALRWLGYQILDIEVKELVKEFDIDGNRTLDFEEFITVMRIMAKGRPRHTFDFKEVAKLRWAFRHFDVDGSGTINARELGTIMRWVGQNPLQSELDDMIGQVDKDKSGALDFIEFLVLMDRARRDGVDEELVRKSFQIFDKDGNDWISAEEFKVFMTQTGECMSEEEVDEMLQVADANKDGKIHYEEFAHIMLSGTTIFDIPDIAVG